MLNYKEVMDAFEEVDLQPEQIEKIYETLENMGIDVVGDIEDELENIEDDKVLDFTVPKELA